MVIRTEERMKIVQLLQDGKIGPEEASELLNAMEAGEEKSTPQARPRWLHIRVTDTDKKKARFNVSLPVALVKAGLKMGARFTPELDGMDLDVLDALLLSGGRGHIVDVVDEADGEHVEIYLE